MRSCVNRLFCVPSCSRARPAVLEMQRKLFKGRDPSTLDWGSIRQQMQGAGLGDQPPPGMADSANFESEMFPDRDEL